jgi:peptidoglycan-N-acetylglucosamine deacetylase
MEGHEALRNLIARNSKLISMRYVFFLCLALFCAGDRSRAQNQSEPSPTAPSVATPTYGIYTHARIQGPYLAMTFDDGPSAEYTPRLLDLLKARHLKATFFLIGQNVQAHPELVRRIIAEGHEVGNHTWDHPQLSKLSDEQATAEIEKTQDAIHTACGVTPVLLRPPYGALNKPQHVWIPERLKLNVIYWSVDTLDWKRPGAATITQRVLAGARPGAIILQHDIHGQTIDAMPAALDGLIAKGYRLVTISQLIAMESSQASPTPSPNVTSGVQSVGPQRDSGYKVP